LHWLAAQAATFRRGFVERVDLCALAFERFGAVLFRTFPVLEVRLTDREPAVEGPAEDKVAAWLHPQHGFPHNSLPPAVWALLPLSLAVSRPGDDTYLTRTPRAAATAAAIACVCYGRLAAGLPALGW
jgi:hypothetical protein